MNTGALRPASVEIGAKGCRLTDAGKRTVLRALERRWSTSLHIAGRAATWRDLPFRHAAALTRAMRDGSVPRLEGPW